jgi:hypothetical protein
MMGAAAKRVPTETELKAHQRRHAFREKIAEKAAALKDRKQGAHRPRDAAPEAVAAQVDRPAADVVSLVAPLPFPQMKRPWFRIVGASGLTSPRVSEIQEVVCAAFGVQLVDLTSARRTANLVKPRQVAMYLAKTMTGRSLPEIGRRFGGRDHTTVLHAVRKIAAKVEFNEASPEILDPQLSDLVKALRSDIEAGRDT